MSSARHRWGHRRALPRLLSPGTALALLAAGCLDADPEGGRKDPADAGQAPEVRIVEAGSSADLPPRQIPSQECTDDSHCPAGEVCDPIGGRCVDCRTDQDCPRADFCIEGRCLADICQPGGTRCYGAQKVAMCKANGGGWRLSPCPENTYCEGGKCVPRICKPGARTCDGEHVVECDEDGAGYDEVQDCAKTQQICLAGECIEKGCKAGEIQCAAVASGPAARICVDPDKGLEVQPCADQDPCTYDLCKAGQGCRNPPKPDGVSCGQDKWCYGGTCAARRSNLAIIFDTSGSMSFKVPGKQCWAQKWPNCLEPHKQCSRMGVSKSVFRKALALLDEGSTRMAMFRFPQLVIAPGQKTSPKPPYYAPPEPTCSIGRYLGYMDMTGHTDEQHVGPGSSWYWDHLDEIRCADFPTSATVTTRAEMLRWMDGKEVYGEEPELRAIGGTPIGRTLFYVGEYLRNRVVVDGKPCTADEDCDNPNYVCKPDPEAGQPGSCHDPMRACRETTIVLFTDGGQINEPSQFFSPWVQAKRLAYGLFCKTDADCAGGARCVCPPAMPGCKPAFKRCMPDEQGTGYYCRTTMKPCLPGAAKGEAGYCPELEGFDACAKDPIGEVTAVAKQFGDNVLRSFDGRPFGVRVHVVDISEQPWGIEKSANIARSGNGLLLASRGQDEDIFLQYLIKAFDVGAKPACGAKSLTCTGQSPGECDDGDPCTSDSCSGITGTCVHLTNTGACDDGDPCTIGERCLGGICRAGLITVSTFAGDGAENQDEGKRLEVGFREPRGLAMGGDGALYVSDKHRIRRIDSAGEVTNVAGGVLPGMTDAAALKARFDTPVGMAWHAATKRLYVADSENHRIRVIDGLQGGGGATVSRYAGSWKGYKEGTLQQALFNLPEDVVIAPTGGEATLFVADRGNRRLRRIDPDGRVSTAAGTGIAGLQDGVGATARFGSPAALAIGPDGAIYIADYHRVRRFKDGLVTTLAGGGIGYKNGVGNEARFAGLLGIGVAVDGTVYVADGQNHRVRRVGADGAVTTLAGGHDHAFADGFGLLARFEGLGKLLLLPGGRMLVADTGNRRIRELRLPDVVCPVGGECNLSFCDPKTGKCAAQPVPDGEPCDGDPCLTGQKCVGLQCAGGLPNDCDDAKSCTDDACVAGGCAHTPNQAPCDDGEACTEQDTCAAGECAGTLKSCDDGDPETADLCYLGKCFAHKATCRADAECDDGEKTCTLDRCVAGACVYEGTGAPGCCQEQPWFNDFEGVDLRGLKIDNSLGPAKGWQLWKKAGLPPLSALYYGDPKAGNFAFSGPSGGRLTTPAVKLPVGRQARLKLWLWMDTEGGRLFDALRIEVLSGSQSKVVWEKNAALELKSWKRLELDLSAFAGREVRARLTFDTVDALHNDGLGVFIDNLGFEVACQ